MTNSKRLSEYELKRLQEFIDAVKWTYAKTMPDCPHFYCVLDDTPELEGEYIWFARLIRDKGYYMMFYERKVRYLDVDDYRYWTMDEKVEDTDLVNRADNTSKGKTYGMKVPD